VNDETWRALTAARRRAGLSMPALYLRYVALGGCATQRDLTAYLTFGTDIADGEHDFAVLAINERFMELGASERLPYVAGLTD